MQTVTLNGLVKMKHLLCLSSWYLVIAVWLFLMMPRVGLQFVIVVFSDYNHLLFFLIKLGKTFIMMSFTWQSGESRSVPLIFAIQNFLS